MRIGAQIKTNIAKDQRRKEREHRKAQSLAIRDGLALMERDHKTKRIMRGGARGFKWTGASRGGGSIKTKAWRWRSGQLGRSYRIEWKRGQLIGYYGSRSVYSAIHERGGHIAGKRGWLTIPLPGARKGISARNYPKGELFPILSKAGNLLLAKKRGKSGIKPVFVLKRFVVIPKRPTIDPMIKATAGKIAELVADASVTLWTGGGRVA